MFQQQRLGEDGSITAGDQQLSNRRDEMDGEYGQVTHLAMLTTWLSSARLGSSRCLCDIFEFATHRAVNEVLPKGNAVNGLFI